MAIKTVALIGANGNLGPSVLRALLAAETFRVTVLTRATSHSQYPASVQTTQISSSPSVEELTEALRGQDAVIVTFAGTNGELQKRLADAAVRAGVQRFIPADFGSCDSSSARALQLMPLYRTKSEVRRYLGELAAAAADGFSWTSLVCGHFFDYGLKSGLLLFDLETCSARILDGGDVRWSATITDTIGTAVVRVLQNLEETRNRMLYIQSFCVSQNDVLKSLERLTGKVWKVEQLDSEELLEEAKIALDRDPNNHEASKNIVGALGMMDANWEKKEDFANALLGLEDEDLDGAIKKVIDS